MCQNEPSFSQNSPSLPQNSVRLSEFSSLKQYSRNSIPPVSYKGRFWRTCPRSGFCSGGTCERTLVPVSTRGSIRMYPRSGFHSGGTSAKTTLWKTTLLSAGRKKGQRKGATSKNVKNRQYPVLPFLDLLVFIKENPQTYQGFSVPAEPTNSLETEEKTPKYPRKFLVKY